MLDKARRCLLHYVLLSVADPEDFYRLLGGRVEDARHRKGLTQEALARRLTPQQTRASISNIEKGTQRVLVHTLVQLAAALDTGVIDLLPVEPAHATRHGEMERTLAANLQLSKKELKHLVAQLQPEKKQ